MTETTNEMNTALTADIVSAYVANNNISTAELPSLIASVHGALSRLGQPEAPEVEAVSKPTPAQVRKSISDKGLVSFLDERTYQSLKRHLNTRGVTPAQYRETYGLPNDYPMVAPAYAAKRSALAKELGLGRKRAEPTPAPEPVPAKRTRKPKAAAE